MKSNIQDTLLFRFYSFQRRIQVKFVDLPCESFRHKKPGLVFFKPVR